MYSIKKVAIGLFVIFSSLLPLGLKAAEVKTAANDAYSTPQASKVYWGGRGYYGRWGGWYGRGYGYGYPYYGYGYSYGYPYGGWGYGGCGFGGCW